MSSIRMVVWLTVLMMTIITVNMFLIFFPQNYPVKMLQIEETVREFLDEITLPIKLTRLSLQEPDDRVLMPVYGTRVASVTDSWNAPRGNGRLHEGQDIFADRGTPVFSATDGYLHRIRTTEVGGHNVFITGAGGRRYYYAHLDRFADGLRIGQWVTTDTVIGFVGNSGNAEQTPPHLHFSIYQHWQAIDPMPLLTNR